MKIYWEYKISNMLFNKGKNFYIMIWTIGSFYVNKTCSYLSLEENWHVSISLKLLYMSI